MDSNPSTIVTSAGTALISPPVTFDDFVREINFGGITIVLVVVERDPVSPLNTHQGETSAMMRRPIEINFIPADIFRFQIRYPSEPIIRARPR